jgi:two-component system CheB/CheR fusion protein
MGIKTKRPEKSAKPAAELAVSVEGKKSLRQAPPIGPRPHFVVGVGASAGGLEAIGKLFNSMPADSGLSFVVVQHLSPDYKSFMVELLSKRTGVPVLPAEDNLEVKPNHVYLIPPKKNLKIFQGKLLLVDPDMSRGFNLPIDVFFRSLAEEKQHLAIGIVLSGTGSDGTMGIRAIKDAGGMVLVQTEATAQFDGMPRSAIGTGLADFILPPEEMPGQLLSYLKHPFVAKQETILRTLSSTDSLMHKIFSLIRDQCGADFSFYKPSVIDRRIARRISINQLENLEEYYRYLHTSPREANVLFNELLICVTRFFRDREAFEFLENTALPDLLKAVPVGEPIRVWVPSCSTGEEAYSLAMLFTDEMRRQKKNWPVKIFATDISKKAIENASQGLYSESEVADVPPEKLRRYFARRAEGWQISQGLRQMVVFARHDLLKDPPFTKLDLVSCRNVLIYFQPPLQSRVINLFHFALKPGGVLFLGNSETVGEQTDKFTIISSRHKVYQTRQVVGALLGDSRLLGAERGWQPETSRLARQKPSDDLRLLEAVYQEVIADYAPACIVVDENNDIVHLLGKAGDYIRPPAGVFTRNVLKLLDRNLAVTLATMVHRVGRDNREQALENVKFHQGRKLQNVRLRVRPLRPKEKSGAALRLIFIEPKISVPIKKGDLKEFKADRTAAQRIADLEQELAYSKETLQATIEELETSNEELQATNEELLASNEELQSTNEELQSLNEELHTVNTENQNRIEELTALSNDINNLMTTARVGTMLVDAGLRIRRMSSAVHALTNLRPTDFGAPLEVLSRELQAPQIIDLAQRVTEDEQAQEHLAAAKDGRAILVRLVPYKTETNTTSGLVVTLIDLTETRKRESMIQSIIEAIPAHVAVVDEMGRILYVNQPWVRFGQTNDCTGRHGRVGDNYFDVCRRAAGESAEAAACLRGLEAVMRGQLPHFEYEYACHSPSEERWFMMTADPLSHPARGVLLTHLNITSRRKQEERLEKWATLLQSAHQAVIGCDLEGVVQIWNQGAERLLGFPAAEAIGRAVLDFTPPEHRAEHQEAHRRVLQGENQTCVPGRRLTKEQGILAVGVGLTAVRDSSGQMVGISEILCECGSLKRPPTCRI